MSTFIQKHQPLYSQAAENVEPISATTLAISNTVGLGVLFKDESKIAQEVLISRVNQEINGRQISTHFKPSPCMDAPPHAPTPSDLQTRNYNFENETSLGHY